MNPPRSGSAPARCIETPARRRLLVGLGALACAPRTGAQPAPFPSRTVRLLVPYSVGVGPDVVARGLAARLAERWHQPVVVENKPGASGIVAFAEVRRLPADGHTLLIADTATLAVNPLLHASLPYDPDHDLAPLTGLFQATFVLWTGGRGRFATLAALLEDAGRGPERVSYASLGNGHASQVAIEQFARAAGVRLLHVPFRDAGALTAAVAAGDVDLTAFGVNTVAGLMQSGRLRALSVAARRRLPDHPDIPTVTQAGGPDVELHPWAALVTLAGTPQPLLERLHGDLVEAIDSAALRTLATQAGFDLTPSTPQAVQARARADRALYAPLVAEGRVARF